MADNDSPKIPSRPTGARKPVAGGAAPARPGTKPATAAKPASAQVASQNADSADDEHLEEEYEGSTLAEYLKQSPAWLTSMVVHMILLLVLALVTFSVMPDDAQQLVISPNEALEEVEDPKPDKPPNPEMEVDVETDIVEEIENISEVDFDVAEPMEIPNDNDENELAAAVVEINPLASIAVAVGVANVDTGGVSTKGLGGRTAAGRKSGASGGGGAGSPGSESAVDAALRWISLHQSPDGSWDFRLPHGPCAGGGCDGAGTVDAKHGGTGLALLAFLGAGHTHQSGEYQEVVTKGLSWMVRNMKVTGTNGDLTDGGHAGMYAHGIASMALTEAYGMTQDKKLLAPAQMSLNFIAYAQGSDGGWRYHPKELGDTSAVGWQIMALKSGNMSYLKIPKRTIAGSHQFLNKTQGDAYGGQYGYETKGHKITTSAIGCLCRVYLGWDKDHQGLQAGAGWMSQHGPHLGNGGEKMYYNYYATQFMYQFTSGEGEMWENWNVPMRDHLVKTQARGGAAHGSWNFGTEPAWGARFYDTCLACMTLEVYYRYSPVYKKEGSLQAGDAEFNAEDDFPLE